MAYENYNEHPLIGMAHHIAMVCHQANKAFCEVHGDYSQKDWFDAPDWQKESAIKGVLFRIDNPTAGDDAQHNSWMKEKLDAGWVYGEVKDAEKKTHPCLVPFSELPPFQLQYRRIKNLFVDALAGPLLVVNKVTTYGQKAVKESPNPSGDDAVASCKQGFANEIDRMHSLRNTTESNEQKRLASVAITEMQGAQMWAVKALTWKD